MEVFYVTLLVIFCVLASMLFYKLWMRESATDDPKYEYCVTKGDMYCSHTDWCEAEKILFPEQYAEETNKLSNT